MDTQNSTPVSSAPTTHTQVNATEPIGASAEELSATMQESPTPDMFAPEQLRLTL